MNSGGQINPFDLNQNYGNADYDTLRQYISANYSIAFLIRGGPHVLTYVWQIAGTDLPQHRLSLLCDGCYWLLSPMGNAALAKQIDNSSADDCGGSQHVATSCAFASHFTSSIDYGQQRRNQIYGPNYTDFDMDISKSFHVVPKKTNR